MENDELVKIRFCFPDTPKKTREEFIDAVVEKTGFDQERGYGAYQTQDALRKNICNFYNHNNARNYKFLPDNEKSTIEGVIRSSLSRCNKKVPHPNQPIFVYILPWFPEGGAEIFNSVMGMAFWKNALHLYIFQKNYSLEEIEKTVAHEYNHTVYFNYYIPNTLYENMILEGLAENFREEAVGGDPAPWSTVLSKNEAKDIFQNLKSFWNSSDDALRRQIFYGEDYKYKNATGYSIGYWIIKSFRENYPDIEWKKIMEMYPEEILEKADFIQK